MSSLFKQSRFATRLSALPAAGMLLAAAGAAATASASTISWNTINGSWFNGAHWTGGAVPDFGDDVRIGNLAGVHDGLVLGGGGAGSLELDHHMTLDLNGSEFGTFGDVDVMGGSRIIVRPNPMGPNQHDFSGRLHLQPGSDFELRDNAPVRLFSSIGAHSYSYGTVSGRGTIDIHGNGAFRNEGVILPDANGGLVIAQDDPIAGLGRIDLDGQFENGQLHLTAPFSQLEVRGEGLLDTFGGSLIMGSGSLLTMSLNEQWTADTTSFLNISGSIAGAAAQIAGSPFRFLGHMSVGGSEGHLRLLADTTVYSNANIDIGEDDLLDFAGAAILQGGTFDFEGGLGAVRFNGPTALHGGTFSMESAGLLDGRVEFNGETTWDGVVNIGGFGRQTGDAVVSGATTINAGVFQMRGANGDTNWQVNNSLVVNADRVGLHSDNNFSGTMDISGGVFGRLTINLTDPNEAWGMTGAMNLAGSGGLPVTRVAGSRMAVTGDLNVTGGIVQITADTALAGADVNIANGSTLRMRGRTTIDAATDFSGGGTLENGLGGEMILAPTSALEPVALTNNAAFRIGENVPGLAGVGGFTNGAAGVWEVDIGGPDVGVGHDLLICLGAASLNGTLLVSLLDLGAGVFAPGIGDEFLILRSFGGVTGKFLNDPVSQVGDLTYEWSVVYDTGAVSLRLDNIVPAPGSAVLAGIGALILAPRRRR